MVEMSNPSGALEGAHRSGDTIHTTRDVTLELEVPESDDRPPVGFEPFIHEFVTLTGRQNLRIPPFRQTPGLPPRRMPMPPSGVHEHRDPAASPGEIRRPEHSSYVTTPTANACRPERLPESDLGLGVLCSHPTHDAASHLRRHDVRHI
jgi:hypothetical protein